MGTQIDALTAGLRCRVKGKRLKRTLWKMQEGKQTARERKVEGLQRKKDFFGKEGQSMEHMFQRAPVAECYAEL